MASTVTITVSDAGPRAALRAISAVAQSREAKAIIGRSATNLVQRHLRDLNQSRPNKLGGRRSNFYAAAADSTHFTKDPDGVTVSVTHTGFALRYHGGTVRPVNAKALAIPARPEVYGYRPREFQDLFVVWKPGKTAGVLARRAGSRLEVLFFLVAKATIKADPTLLPQTDAISAHVAKALSSYIERQIQRGNPQ